MGRSQRIRLKDMRDICRLVGECRELGRDSNAWRTHMFSGLRRLTGACVALGGELEGWPDLSPRITQTIDIGWPDAAARQRWQDYFKTYGIANDTFYQRLARLPGPLVTRCRYQLVEDAEWYPTELFQDYMRPMTLDDRLVSFYTLPGGTGGINGINLYRLLDDRPFSPRDRRLVHLFHHELGPLIGDRLVRAGERPRPPLPPRLRQVLDRLLLGDGEKQIAYRLCISRHTVHHHVRRLYRHFDVQSRAELLARFVERPS